MEIWSMGWVKMPLKHGGHEQSQLRVGRWLDNVRELTSDLAWFQSSNSSRFVRNYPDR